MPDSDVTIDYLMDNVFIVGSADEVTQKLNDLNGELGGFGTLLAMGHEWDPYDAWYESMSVLVKEVLPKVD
jgi:alkanesulfonate monooxygenase SsuD/methylene tetrahydromethanopterin reductase-like flavin-dependent oxidoreductase (luciferase family)